MTEFMTPKHFSGKVEWEGGILGALEYGLRHTSLNSDDPASAELRTAWAELERLYGQMEPQLDLVGGLLEAIDDASGEDD